MILGHKVYIWKQICNGCLKGLWIDVCFWKEERVQIDSSDQVVKGAYVGVFSYHRCVYGLYSILDCLSNILCVVDPKHLILLVNNINYN